MNREDLRRPEDAISACRLCSLWQARVRTVPGAGSVLNRLILRTAISTRRPPLKIYFGLKLPGILIKDQVYIKNR